MRTIATATLSLALFSLPAVAAAGPNDNSSSRPWSVPIGAGPMVGIPRGGVLGKFGVDFQYHFKGGDVGPALGGMLHTHFAQHTFGFNVGPIFMWDFRVYQTGRFKLYLAPLIGAGYSFTANDFHAFFMDLGGQLKGVVNDRVGFFVRPINFSMFAFPGGAAGAWTLFLGITFSA
jgi:hypothetical protein